MNLAWWVSACWKQQSDCLLNPFGVSLTAKYLCMGSQDPQGKETTKVPALKYDGGSGATVKKDSAELSFFTSVTVDWPTIPLAGHGAEVYRQTI